MVTAEEINTRIQAWKARKRTRYPHKDEGREIRQAIAREQYDHGREFNNKINNRINNQQQNQQ